MEEFVSILKKLTIDFSYNQFLEVLRDIDSGVNNQKITYFDAEFIDYFKKIIRIADNECLIDNNHSELGHRLVENVLLNKKRLTPTLVLCFLLEQKEKLGLDDICNEFEFIAPEGIDYDYRMVVVNYRNTGRVIININWQNHYVKSIKSVDEYNYDLMHDLLHELTHVYQLSRHEQTENTFDKLMLYDYEMEGILIRNSGYISYPLFHEDFVPEYMADEEADVFLFDFAKNNPGYFNDELVNRKKREYKFKKSRIFDKSLYDPRKRFHELLCNMREANVKNKKAIAVLDTIEIIKKKTLPLIEILQKQGISEKSLDMYYNIYLKTLYKFDGENIIYINNAQDRLQKVYK